MTALIALISHGVPAALREVVALGRAVSIRVDADRVVDEICQCRALLPFDTRSADWEP